MLKIKLADTAWLSKTYSLRVLQGMVKTKIVNNNEDLFFEGVEHDLSDSFKLAKRKILFSAENLCCKYGLSRFIYRVLLRLRLSSLYPFFVKILPYWLLDIPICMLRKKYCNFIKKLIKTKSTTDYAILCDSNKGENIFNLPFFISAFYLYTKGFVSFTKMGTTSPQIYHRENRKFCCAIVSNTFVMDRVKFIKQLSKYKVVDCYGKSFLTNVSSSKLGKTWFDNHKLYKEYKFVICFENIADKHYVSEKLLNAMLVNAIPIYKGTTDVSTYFHTESFIDYNDYDKSYNKMIKKIIELDNDEKKYLEFLNRPWMTKQNFENTQQKVTDLKAFLKIAAHIS